MTHASPFGMSSGRMATRRDRLNQRFIPFLHRLYFVMSHREEGRGASRIKEGHDDANYIYYKPIVIPVKKMYAVTQKKYNNVGN